MIKKIVLMSFIVGFTATSSRSTILRVDKNAANNPDFTDLQTAHDAASSGDTLHVAGSATVYGNLTLTKTLFIIGTGYYLDKNPETQVRTLSAAAGLVTFNSGSEGSLITGCDCERVSVNVNNITIKRNKITTSYPAAILHIGSGLSNIIIEQSYIINLRGSLGIAVEVEDNCSNIIISNNYIQSLEFEDCIISSSLSSLQVNNNVLLGTLNLHNSIFYNNILRGGGFSVSDNDVRNNIGNSTQFGSSNGNQENIDMSTVFVGTGSTDGQWQLKEGSPAIGAGINGEDCGMFGGNDAYVLSGLPTVPAIYFFYAPLSGSGSQGLPVQVKIKSHN